MRSSFGYGQGPAVGTGVPPVGPHPGMPPIEQSPRSPVGSPGDGMGEAQGSQDSTAAGARRITLDRLAAARRTVFRRAGREAFRVVLRRALRFARRAVVRFARFFFFMTVLSVRPLSAHGARTADPRGQACSGRSALDARFRTCP